MHVARVLSAITGLMVGGVLAGGILGWIVALLIVPASAPYGGVQILVAGMGCGLIAGLVTAVVWLVRETNRPDRERRQQWNETHTVHTVRNRTNKR